MDRNLLPEAAAVPEHCGMSCIPWKYSWLCGVPASHADNSLPVMHVTCHIGAERRKWSGSLQPAREGWRHRSFEEIGDILGYSETSVRRIYDSAIRKMAEMAD